MDIQKAKKLIRAPILDLKSYHLAPEKPQVKLNQNESPYDWPEWLKTEVLEQCGKREWNRYPPFIPDELKRLLSQVNGVSEDSIIVGNGSNEMLLVCLLSIVERDTPVIITPPCFTVYGLLANGLGGYEERVMLNDDLTFNVEGIVEKCKSNPGAVVVMASPNNPTGSQMTRDELSFILDNHEGFVILDQAYVEFGGYDAAELVNGYPNLIVTRTLSKAVGSAGLRLGYMIAEADITAQINKIKLPYNINFFSIYAAMKLLAHREVISQNVERTVQQREILYDSLRKLPLDNCYNTPANFVLIRTGRKDALFSYLRDNGVLVRDVSNYPKLAYCLRLSVGTQEENARLRELISAFFSSA